MQFFPTNKIYNFMGGRGVFSLASLALVLVSIGLLVYPGPSLGTDFRGGTEIEVAFVPPISPVDIRKAVADTGFHSPDVIKVQSKNEAQYLIRVEDVSEVSDEAEAKIARAVCYGEDLPQEECPASEQASEMKISPGGDKVTVRFREEVEETQLARLRQRFIEQVTPVTQIQLREGESNPSLQSARDHKVEIQLMSKGDQLMKALREKLGEAKVPVVLPGQENVAPEMRATNPLRAEWIGPKAGKQLRDSAIASIAISLVLIMVYIAFRFDLRFAPGGVISLAHDAIGTLGFLIIFQKEISLSTVAALLTIVGYSINDTVVVYDRVRENMGKLRGMPFPMLINVSLSEMFSRTILTNGVVVLSLSAFFIWGTGELKQFALTLIFGVVIGTYSSIYVALPVTHWLDKTFFAKVAKKKKPTGGQIVQNREANA